MHNGGTVRFGPALTVNVVTPGDKLIVDGQTSVIISSLWSRL
jgi:hypothetical protein